MKKIMLIIITAFGILGLTGCGNTQTSDSVLSDNRTSQFAAQQTDFTEEVTEEGKSETDNSDKTSIPETVPETKEISDSTEKGTLVVYFSRTGTTRQIAEYIIDFTGADSFEIKAAVSYTDEDINYSNSSCRANKEQNDKSVRPEITDTIENIDQYDTIFLGYPIWWGEEPRIIDTFLESYDFSDKTVIPFCTSASSGISTSERNIKNLDVSYRELLNGRRFSTDSTKEDVFDWLDTFSL